MNRIAAFIVVAFLALSLFSNAFLSYLLYLTWPPLEGELVAKTEWSVLQSAVSSMRESKPSAQNGNIVVMKNFISSDFHVLGFFNKAQEDYVLAIANAKTIPGLKFMSIGAGKFSRLNILELVTWPAKYGTYRSSAADH